MTKPKKPTPKDLAIIAAIRAEDQKTGCLRLNPTGELNMETRDDVSSYRIQRLIALGLLKPGGDALFPEIPSQTVRLADAP